MQNVSSSRVQLKRVIKTAFMCKRQHRTILQTGSSSEFTRHIEALGFAQLISHPAGDKLSIVMCTFDNKAKIAQYCSWSFYTNYSYRLKFITAVIIYNICSKLIKLGKTTPDCLPCRGNLWLDHPERRFWNYVGYSQFVVLLKFKLKPRQYHSVLVINITVQTRCSLWRGGNGDGR